MAITVPSAEYRGDHVALTWDWADGVSASACTYTVQRCGTEYFSPADAIETLAQGLTVSGYDDYDMVTKDIWREMVYRIVTRVTSGADYLSDVATYNEGHVDRTVEDIRWRLDVGLTRVFGTPVLMFIKKTAGDRCPECWDSITQRTTKAKCPTCFPAGTLVRTNTGYRPIESIVVGDMVLSSDGDFHLVTKTFKNEYEGDLVSFLPSVSSAPILATPDHEFLKMAGTHSMAKWCGPKCSTYMNRDYGLLEKSPDIRLTKYGWSARAQCGGSRGSGRVTLGTFNTREEALSNVYRYRETFGNSRDNAHKIGWGNASAISDKDWLVAQWPRAIINIDQVEIPERFRRKTRLGMPRIGAYKFNVDEDFLWLIGLYLAEGCGSGREITFSLHEKEVDIQDRVMAIMRGYGFHPSLRRCSSGHGVVVSVASTSLSEWFPEWLGSGCQNKHIPEEFMALPKNKLRSLLYGIYDGDGWKNGQQVDQTSEILALQMVEILHRIGERPLLRSWQNNTLTPNGNKRKRCYTVSWNRGLEAGRRLRWEFENNLLTRVRKSSPVQFNGTVYNLEVDGDHTYVVNGVVAHNCLGQGFSGGFYAPISSWIQIRPDPENPIFDAQGIDEKHVTQAVMMHTPHLVYGDVIMDMSNNLFVIIGNTPTMRNGAISHQTITLRLLNHDAIEYDMIQSLIRLTLPRETNVPILR